MKSRTMFSLLFLGVLSACTIQFERIAATDDDDGERSLDTFGDNGNTGDPGQDVFQQLCADCHGSDGSGRQGLGPSLFKEVPKQNNVDALVDVIVNGVFDDGREEMPPTNLPQDSLDAVVEFVISEFCINADPNEQSVCNP